ncbi:DUF2537 domain-containing protein [Pseudonocardia sp. KRD-184]|uniref:DUF2537 domain-containing protein n=1 Tax=Pseudonocardia oceani TaxID=2792013 RepID=A0ABS6UAY3_9PSEU|nr:DUF2537 domain-containing protein [Pseudonocardia oceani]MBW0091980.1 DUF2537 domain-containing protein [Pseudonocardia oceani]MBW0097405.1 DUF2537 domain-containing protein [Pseudonocardia oceani]MBW0111562.1 DUF2537 domain-containing protein [Pseudonocardia oceani]MBW0124142.1 DUF2537 domain-containing protein [Pseudonocardia oceani]MBW0129397.1 DUF2537 domain-containing protein [Pseudonocardia oceani]
MLRAAGGRVELGDRRPEDPPLPDELQAALREWAAFAVAAGRSGMPDERDLVRRRGRQLAARVAGLRGRPVEYLDPMSGVVEEVAAGTSPRRSGSRSSLAVEPAGPTPWATGLPIAAFFAVLVAIGDVQLSSAFAEAFGLLWVPANLLVGLGLAPSLYLLRAVPFWRWPAIGTGIGLAVAWVVLIVSMLG